MDQRDHPPAEERQAAARGCRLRSQVQALCRRCQARQGHYMFRSRVADVHQPVLLADLQRPHVLAQRRGYGSLERFAAIPEVTALGWPLDVVEQWLWDFLDLWEFVEDYSSVDLAGLTWQMKDLPAH